VHGQDDWRTSPSQRHESGFETVSVYEIGPPRYPESTEATHRFEHRRVEIAAQIVRPPNYQGFVTARWVRGEIADMTTHPATGRADDMRYALGGRTHSRAPLISPRPMLNKR
jgi:hypothetical protein